MPVTDCADPRLLDPALLGYPAQITEVGDVQPGGGMVCRVHGYVSPQMRSEVRLPEQGSTRRHLQTGCGGLRGTLVIRAPQRACPALLRFGPVTASTDMGHDTPGGIWERPTCSCASTSPATASTRRRSSPRR